MLAAAGELGQVDLVAIDAAGLFERAATEPAPERGQQGAHARAALDACLQSSWEATHALVRVAYLERGHPGRVVYVAPADAGAHDELARCARAARAALENLARTLSIEWARYDVTTVTIAPGAHSGVGEIAALVAYLASPAGAYFSGCLLDLTGPVPASRASERAR